MNEIIANLSESFKALLDSAVAATPKVITGIVLFLIAIVFCKVVERILRAFLTRLKFDGLIKKAGIDQSLHRLGIRQDLNRFLPRLAYFLLLFLLAKTLSDALGLTAISNALSAFFVYLPNLVTALLLIVLGSSAAQIAGSIVTEASKESGLEFAPALGKIVTGMILFIAGMMAIAQLKIDTEIIRIVTSLMLAGVALAFGLSFGLGTREVLRNILAGFYIRKVLKIGENLEIDGVSGVLVGITSTHALLEQDDRTLTIANTTFLEKVGRQ